MRFPFIFGMLGLIGIFTVFGCRSTQSPKAGVFNYDAQRETPQDVVSAVGVVAGTLGGQAMNEVALRQVAREVQKDPDTRRAVEAIAGALGTGQVQGKYCPVDGRHFDFKVTRCPDHGVALKLIEE